MTLQQKLDAFKAGKPPYNEPPEIHPIMERATRELIASGLAQRALKAGGKAPEFTLPRSERWPGVVGSAARQRSADRFVLPRRVVPVLQPGPAGAAGSAISQFREFGANVVEISPRPHRIAASRYVRTDSNFRS